MLICFAPLIHWTMIYMVTWDENKGASCLLPVLSLDGDVYWRKRLWEVELVGLPGNVAVAVLFKVVQDPPGRSHTPTASHGDPRSAILQGGHHLEEGAAVAVLQPEAL